jgi:hypothetical protein
MDPLARSEQPVVPAHVTSLNDEDEDDETRVIRVTERWVAPVVWSAWRESGRRALRRAMVTSALAGGLVGFLYLWMVMEVIAGPQIYGVATYAPLVALAVWYFVRAFVRRLSFRRTAREMTEVLAPELVRMPSWDDLLSLATRGAGGFAQESIVIRTEPREAAIYLVATEYDVSKDWIGGAGSAGGI